MQETIFKIRFDNWNKAVKALEDNADSLSSSEQDAINTLRNLWRNAQFSADTTRRVERMVKLLSDSDKLHGNNRDIVQASKNLRGVAKVMYATDAETFRQFADAMQKANGGPRRTEPQQLRRTETRQQQRRPQRPHVRQPYQQTTYSHQTSTPNSQSNTRPRQDRQPQPPHSHSVFQPVFSYLKVSWPVYATCAVLLVVIFLGLWTAWYKGTAIQPYDYAKLLKGQWNGDVSGSAATLCVDTIAGDSLQARFFVKTKNRLEKDSLTGNLNVQREGCYVVLHKDNATDSTAADVLHLFISRGGVSLCGNLINGSNDHVSVVNLYNGGKAIKAQLATVGAPQYIIDPLFADSVTCHRAVFKDTVWMVKDYSKSKIFPKGLLIDSCGRSPSGYSFIFMSGGKHYQINRSSLRWSRTNSDSLHNSQKMSVARQHSDIGVFFSTLWPCWLVIGLIALPMLFTIILPLLLSRFEPMRKFLAVVCKAMVFIMPLCLLLVAGIEIADYQIFGGKAFWWCDKDRYGFIGSVLRIIPFLIVVLAQIFSIWWYEPLLFLGDRDDSKKIHMKPAVISFVVSVPVLIVFLLVAQMAFGWKGKDAEWTAVAIFFAIILTGIIITLVRNIRELGAWRGIFITVFVLVYIIGCMVAVGGLVFAVLQVLVPLLCALFGLAIIGGGLLGGGRGETLYRDKYGNLYRRV